MTELTLHGATLLVFTALVFIVFVWDRLPIATVSLAILGLLPLGFVVFPMQQAGVSVDPSRFFAGFGNPALIAICALMVVGQGLVVTGALEPVARRLAAVVARHPRGALLVVLLLAGATSGVINDTPVVVLLIPLLLAAARQAHVAASGMLLPMNYAVLIGGMATTIGTSTNLIIVGIAASLGVAPFGMFDYFGLVAIAAVPALAYLWLIAPRLLAGVPATRDYISDDVFDAELNVEAGSRLDGKPLAQAFAAAQHGFQALELIRGNRSISRLPSVMLRAGDRLIVRDTAVRLKELETLLQAPLHAVRPPGQTPPGKVDGDADADDDEQKPEDAGPPIAIVAQIIVTPTSPLVGSSARREHLAGRYGFVLVGLRPRTASATWQRTDLASRLIDVGDVLLVQGDPEDIKEAQRDGIGLLLDERFTLPRQHKAFLAISIMAIVVLLASTKALPIAVAAVAGAMAMILTRCLTWHDVAQSMSSKIILLVAASLALGDALVVTGTIDWIAQGLATVVKGLSPAWVAALMMGVMGLVTNFVSNNAAAALGTPLAISLAKALGVPPEPFVLAVLFGCNLCYLTPMGYQTNLLVMNAGGYRFGDFLRVGTPLFLIMWGTLSILVSMRYGLWG